MRLHLREFAYPFEMAIMSKVGVKVLLTSGRTLVQGRAMEKGKLSDEYIDAVALCELGQVSLNVLGINDGDLILVETIHGSVVVRSKLTRSADPGIAFMPVGPYFNSVMGSETHESGMPRFKSINAQIFGAKDEEILSLTQLLEEMESE